MEAAPVGRWSASAIVTPFPAVFSPVTSAHLGLQLGRALGLGRALALALALGPGLGLEAHDNRLPQVTANTSLSSPRIRQEAESQTSL